MSNAYPVCLHLNSQDFWVVWCPEDEKHPDHFLTMNGMLVWSRARELLCRFASEFCNTACNSECSFFDIDFALRKLENESIDTPELLLNIWNLLSDLTLTDRHMMAGPFCRELVGAVEQYDLLFFSSQGEKVVNESASSTSWNIPLLQRIFRAGHEVILMRLSSGHEVQAIKEAKG